MGLLFCDSLAYDSTRIQNVCTIAKSNILRKQDFCFASASTKMLPSPLSSPLPFPIPIYARPRAARPAYTSTRALLRTLPARAARPYRHAHKRALCLCLDAHPAYAYRVSLPWHPATCSPRTRCVHPRAPRARTLRVEEARTRCYLKGTLLVHATKLIPVRDPC